MRIRYLNAVLRFGVARGWDKVGRWNLERWTYETDRDMR